jgi:UDP-N-acetylmuramate--alanine ligase
VHVSSSESSRWRRAGNAERRCERDAHVSFSAPVHFVGISGIGMSALARVLHGRGVAVSGCSDRRTELTDSLVREGIAVAVGHSAVHVRGAKTVIVSSAIAADNPEVTAAQQTGVTLWRRGALLAALMADAHGIAVAGTHGKTTTTAMLGAMLTAAGWDPTVVVGGELADGATNARNGRGPWFVAESDESDGSFLELRPRVAIVTNIENDHVTSQAELGALVASFDAFLGRVEKGGSAIVGIDEPRSAELAARSRASRTVTFGFAGAAQVRAEEVRYARFGSTFAVVRGRERLGTVGLGVPGAINVQNALGAIAAALELGTPFAGASDALARFRGVRRRFDVLLRSERMTVVDDYAHHPTAVEATIAAARADWDGPVVVAFQPHRYTRTRYLAGDFTLALRGADYVVLTGIYGASETPIPGVDSRLIGEPLRARGTDVAYVERVEDLADYLLEVVPRGALVLLLGAGTITAAAHRLAALAAARSRDAG